MDIEGLTESILEAIYHSAVFHEDPSVQEQIVRVDITNLLEDYIEEPLRQLLLTKPSSKELRDLEEEIIELEGQIEDLEDELHSYKKIAAIAEAAA